MNTTLRRHILRLIAGFASAVLSASAQQTAPQAVPVPFASFYAGNGTTAPSTACTANVLTTSGANVGDGCPPAQAAVSAPQGVSTDSYGNVYFADYNNKLVRVVYNGNPKLAAAITAANSGFSISASRNSNNTVPVVGNIYTIAGGLSAVISGTTNYCANYAGSGQTVALNTVGDGCPGAATYVGSRAVTTDADGNIFIADYVNSRIRVLCVDCSAGKPAQQLITTENPSITAPVNGYIYPIAGYTGATNSSTGTGGANGFRDAIIGNNTAASDSSTGSMMREPTGIVVDAFDDIYIADQGNNAVRVIYNQAAGGTNALANLILATEAGNTTFIIGSGATGPAPPAVSSVTKGYLYTLAGTACHIGTSSGGSSSYVCLAASSGVNNLLATKTAFNTTWGLAVDAGGNVYVGDGGTGQVRVIYGGVSNPLTLPNAGTTTLTLGDVYLLSGNGTVTQNGVTAYNESYTAPEGLGFDAAGNLYVSDTSKNILFEIYASTGLVAQIAGNSPVATPATNLACNGTTGTLTGPIMSDAFGDNCPATQAKFAAPRGNIALDPQGNILFTDNSANNIRKLSYNTQFPNTATTAASATQPQAFTFMSTQTLSATAPVSFLTLGAAGTDFADAGGDTCTASLAATILTTCVVNTKFTPQAMGVREGAVTLNSTSGRIGAEVLGGSGLLAELAVDPGTPSTTGTNLVPNGIAIDASGSVYISDTHSGSVFRYTSGTQSTIATGFSAPAGLAFDGQGNLFVADSQASTITEIPAQGTRFTLTSAVSHPHGLFVDNYGNLFIADTGNNRIAEIAAGGSTPITRGFTGLSAPQAVSVTAGGAIYAADTGNSRVVALTSTGQLAFGISLASSNIAVDPALNIYLTNGTSVYEYPNGSTSGALIGSGLVTPQALALDSTGNLYIADTGLAGYVQLARTNGAYTFGTSPAVITISNISNQPVNLTGTPFYTQTDATDFSITIPGTGGCTTSVSLIGNCTLTAAFTPTASGNLSDTLTIHSNAPGIQFTLSGTGSAVATTTGLTLDIAGAIYGHTTVLTATVSSVGGAPTTGSVTFKSGSTTLGSANVNTSGVAVLNIVEPIGSYPALTAVYVPAGFSFLASTSTQSLSLLVTAATLTVTATSTSRVFNTANPSFTYTITGFVNGDTQLTAVTGAPAESTTATISSPSASYPITITQGTLAAANYIFTFVNGTLVVSGSTAQTITFNTLPNATYGATPITLGATASSGLAVSYAVTGPASLSGSVLTITGAGSVTVTASQNGNNTYAAATSVPQSFFVGKATLAVTATPASRLYGTANATLAYTITGFVNAQTQAGVVTGTPAEATAATLTSSVAGSPYPITIAAGSLAAANYNFGFTNGALTVTPAVLTVTAANASRNYGVANPTLTAAITGQKNGEIFTANATTTATITSPVVVGGYAITPSITSGPVVNYTVTPVNGTLTINTVTPIATVGASSTSIFGGNSDTLTATFTSPTSGTPTGTATFFSGATQIGAATTLSGGIAVLTTTALPVGSDSITAVYSTDANFSAATTPPLTVTIAAPFSIASSTLALTMPHAYQQATANLTINPGGSTNTLTFACTGLPAQLSCSFSPTTLSLSGITTPQTVVMTVSNSNASAQLELKPASHVKEASLGGLLLALPVALLLWFGAVRKRVRLGVMLVMLFALFAAGAGLTGCGGGNFLTPDGSYNFQMTVSSGSSAVQTFSYTLTVQ